MNPKDRDRALVGEILDELAVIDKRLAKGKQAYDSDD